MERCPSPLTWVDAHLLLPPFVLCTDTSKLEENVIEIICNIEARSMHSLHWKIEARAETTQDYYSCLL
jgi:hypothetical protein